MMAWQIFPFLFSLWIISASAGVFVSIDCGSSDLLYTDENKISWVGDSAYIQNGETKVLQSTNSQVMNTLRFFTTRNKNCYSIKAEPNGRVLLRVSFYYGNYDNLSSPPSFNLQFDGNDWVTVETSLNEVVTYEVIYVVKGENLSVCVAKTLPKEFPFISAIEVRSLDATMYNKLQDDNFALFLVWRIAYGTAQIIRYKDDIYDRIWNPSSVGSGIISVSNDATLIYNDGGDKPPTAVLQNAITASDNTITSISLFTLQPSVFPLYINMYFSEVNQLQSTAIRSFSVFNGTEYISDPISPPYGNFTEFHAVNISSNTTFYLVATLDSTLPPLINALEVFNISNKLTSGTNSNDLDGLAALQTGSPLLQEWSGDPCLPAPYSWDWINCSSDAIPRVTALYLSSYGLEGLLANFSSMDRLESIDLQNNSFIGPIPDFLGMFPNLTKLNLADNNFSGAVPESLLKKNSSDLNLVVTGNPDLCTSGKSCNTINTTSTTGSPAVQSKKKSSKLPIILGVAIPLFILGFLLVWVIVAILYHRRKAAAAALINANNGQIGTTSPSPFLVNPQVGNNNNYYHSHVEMNGQYIPGLDHHMGQRQ